MNCSNCGKTIPFAGNVCPYCGVSKSKDQLQHVLGMVGIAVFGFFGWIITNHVGWTIGIAIAGGVVGIIIPQIVVAIQQGGAGVCSTGNPEMQIVHCKHCSGEVSVNKGLLGSKIVCYRCGKEFVAAV